MLVVGLGTLLGLSLAGGALSGAIGLGQQGWNNSFQREEAEKARAFSAEQAEITRNFNAEQAALQRSFSSNEAQIARDWSEKMASTAYQRTVADMKRSGINPAMLGGTMATSAVPGTNAPSGGSASANSAAANPVPGGKISPTVDFSKAILNAFVATARENSSDFGDNVVKSLKSSANSSRSAMNEKKTLEALGWETL